MRMKLRVLGASVALAGAVLASGCVQYPTENASVSDMRPQISFRAEGSGVHDARIVVDALDMGRVGDYLAGEAALRVLPGTHVIRVVAGSAVLLDEKVYLGDGVGRSFSVK